MKKVAKRKTITAVIVGIITLIILSAVSLSMLRHDIEQTKVKYRYIAENEADHIVTIIDCIMARTNTLKAMVQDHHGEIAFFDEVAKNVYDSVREETGVSLKNIAVAPDGVVASVYPLKGNESLIGFDFMDLSQAGNAEAKEAYEKNETILTNPFELIQGGMGMAGRAPVILDTENGQSLWGLVTVTIDFDNLIQELHLDNVIGMGANYSLSYIDGEGVAHEMESDGTVGEDAVRTSFTIRNLTWELAVVPTAGWFPAGRMVIAVIVILAISAFFGVFAYLFLKLRETNDILLEMSHTDKMTGCANRRAFEGDLIHYGQTPPGDDFVYVSADVNGLKKVNDTLGHAAGDELLCGAVECMNKHFHEYGRLYRTGGDEFIALLHIDQSRRNEVFEGLQQSVESWKGKLVDGLSLSVGYASAKENPGMTIKDLAWKADQAMYDAKREYYRQNGSQRRQYVDQC